MKTTISASAKLSESERAAAARGCMVKFSSGRRRVIGLAEALLFPFVRAVDWWRSRQSATSEEIQRILVVEAGYLGDIVALLPFLKNLRIHYPSARIALLANPKMFPLLDNLQLVDDLIPARFPWSVHFSQWKRYNPVSLVWVRLAGAVLHVRRHRFDIIFSGRGDLRDNFVVWLTGIRRRVGYGFLGGGFLLTEVVPPDLDRLHCSERWLALLEYLGKPALDRHPRLAVSVEERNFAEKYLTEKGIADGDVIIGIHPGARIPTRQWGAHNFSAVGESLANQFSIKILWFQDPNQGQSETISPNFIPAALPLRQFIALLARCKLLVCNDSGPMHIATALNIPVVAVFGPTEPAWWGPLGEQNRVVIRRHFWCRPCTDRCIFDQPYCLRTISMDEVVQAAEDSIRSVLRASSR